MEIKVMRKRKENIEKIKVTQRAQRKHRGSQRKINSKKKSYTELKRGGTEVHREKKKNDAKAIKNNFLSQFTKVNCNR